MAAAIAFPLAAGALALQAAPQPLPAFVKQCPMPATELIFNSIVAGLFLERRIPRGSVIDAGCLDGKWSCFYAQLDHARAVHAFDPLPGNIYRLMTRYKMLDNLRPHLGGLSDVAEMRYPPVRRSKVGQIRLDTAPIAGSPAAKRAAQLVGDAGPTLPIYRVDDFFANETVGFAHWDVEGYERKVLGGARQMIRRDLPVFSVEVHVHLDRSYSVALLRDIESLDYDAYLVEEPCGVRADCRNLLCFPRARARLFTGSPTLSLALASRTLVRVTSESIVSMAYPCCAKGGACCQQRGSCCNFKAVIGWRVQQLGGREDPSGFSLATVYNQNQIAKFPQQTDVNSLFGPRPPAAAPAVHAP